MNPYCMPSVCASCGSGYLVMPWFPLMMCDDCAAVEVCCDGTADR